MNLMAVVVAALSSFLVGGLWYSPALFGTVWNRESGRNPKGEAGRHPAKVFGVSFLFSLVAAYLFAWLLGPIPRSTPRSTMDCLSARASSRPASASTTSSPTAASNCG